MRAVNLLPRDFEQKRKAPSAPVVVACGMSVVAAGVLAVSYLQASSSVGKQSTALAAAQTELTMTPPPAPPPATVTSLPTERQQRTAALATALSQRVAWDRVLREVSLVLPDDVWLNQLTAQQPTAGEVQSATTTAGTIPTDFQIQGFTYSQASVARLLARLQVIPDLSDVTLRSSAVDTSGTRPIVSFEISANVRLAGVTS